jgi:Uma2 family endonuclease
MCYTQSMNVVRKLMNGDQFLEWRQDKPGRWELVRGAPVQMMAGAKQRHDRIVVNLIATFRQRLKGGPCRPWSADIATRIPSGNVRQPHVTIDCGPIRDDALDSTAPTVVFEVLSPSTRTFDQVRKVDEYKTVPSLRHIVLIDPDRPRVVLWSRADEAAHWADEELAEGALNLGAAGTSITIVEIYEDVKFEAGA